MEIRDERFGFRDSGVVVRVSDLGFGVQAVGLRVVGLGFRVED